MRLFTMLAAGLALVFTSCDNGLTPEERLERDEQLILDYLSNNGLTADRDPSGLYIDLQTPGTGERPSEDQFVEIRYRGYFLDNSVFDETDEDEDPLIVPLRNLPQGLVIGIATLQEGAEATFYLPGQLGNGNDVLVFDIQLIEVFDTQAEADDKKIRNYLDRNELDATRDETGIYYNIDNPGNNITPSLRDTVEVRYKGYLLNDSVFDETPGSTTTSFTLENLIEGWQIGVPLIEEGGSGTLYIPSDLGYGDQPQGNAIPPNSVLVFDIELVDIAFEQ